MSEAITLSEGGVRSAEQGEDVDLVKALGSNDFTDYVAMRQEEFALAAVNAPIEGVARTLAEHWQARRWERDIACRSVAPAERGLHVFQLRGHEWTIVLRAVFSVDAASLEAAERDARLLSERLGAKAIAFTSEESAGATSYHLLERGQTVERARWVAGDLVRFESTLREAPAPVVRREDVFGAGLAADEPEGEDEEDVDDEALDGDGLDGACPAQERILDDTFRSHGLYLPACHVAGDGRETWLVLGSLPVSAVERADYLAL